MGIADELQKLEQLRLSGSLTDEEFGRAKTQLLAAPPTPTNVEVSSFLENQMAEIRYQNELARIDREWEIERQKFQMVGRSGRVFIPTIGTGIATAFVGGFVGVFLIMVAITTIAAAASFGFDSGLFSIMTIVLPLIGAFIIIWAIGRGFYCCILAQNYNAAFNAYKRRRENTSSGRIPS